MITTIYVVLGVLFGVSVVLQALIGFCNTDEKYRIAMRYLVNTSYVVNLISCCTCMTGLFFARGNAFVAVAGGFVFGVIYHYIVKGVAIGVVLTYYFFKSEK